MTRRAWILAVLFVATGAFLARAQKAEPIPIKQPLAEVPLALGAWTGREEPPFSKEILDVLGVDEYIVRTYATQGAGALGLYVGYYQSQRQGDTIHSPLNCLPGAGWIPVEQGHERLTVSGADGPRSIEVNRVVIEKGLDRQLVLYWYQSHNRVVASEYWGKVYTVVDAIRDNRTDAALVRVTVPLADRSATAAAHAGKSAGSFVQSLFPALERHLPS